MMNDFEFAVDPIMKRAYTERIQPNIKTYQDIKMGWGKSHIQNVLIWRKGPKCRIFLDLSQNPIKFEKKKH